MESKRGAHALEWNKRTLVMGIVNCTPDSFSGDGVQDVDAAVAQGVAFVQEGVDVLDVGGQSTRPGAVEVEVEQELDRVLPVIACLAARVQVPISVDTSRAAVARAALIAGAVMVNDVWGLRRDPDMAQVVAAADAWVVLMHNRAAPPVTGALGGHYHRVPYESGDIVQAVGGELERRVGEALQASIAREHIIIDPGIGFGKSVEQNLDLLRRLGELKARPGLAGLPLLIGTSRKSVIGLTLNLPVSERLEGTLATLALAIAQGADMVRVHDVRAAVRCCRMADAIVRGTPVAAHG
ncbi:MAG: dihydropteroate synthase [Anaerolineae bacterium]